MFTTVNLELRLVLVPSIHLHESTFKVALSSRSDHSCINKTFGINTLFSSFLSCSTSSACCCRVVFGVHIGLDLTCSTALTNRSNWLVWLLDITPALCRARNWFIASERSCLYVSHAPRDLIKRKTKTSDKNHFQRELKTGPEIFFLKS